MTLGGKYKWKPSDVPPPGYYNADANVVKPRIPVTQIKQPQMALYNGPL